MNYTLRRIRYRAMRTKLRVPVTWLLHRSLKSRDVFIGSFPRSGSHWLKFQLLEILTGESAEFDSVKRLIPRVGDHGVPGAALLRRVGLVNPEVGVPILPGGARLIHTHEPHRREYRKAIYLVRDLRDVVLSAFAQQKELDLLGYYDLSDFDSFLERFVNGTINRHGTWQDHIISWLESPLATNGNLLVIRFEDLRRNTEDLLAQALEFLGEPADRQLIRQAIANNTLQRMRAKEDATNALHRSSGEEGRFVRKGAVGGWRERLTEGQVQLIERHAGCILSRMGYPVSELLTGRQISR